MMSHRVGRLSLSLGAVLLALNCAPKTQQHGPAHNVNPSHSDSPPRHGLPRHSQEATSHLESSDDGAPSADEVLHRVASIHGGSGPWAVAGYRMGAFALKHLQLPRGSFDVHVEHRSPLLVQYSCIADGAAAATGASVGKLNLSLSEAPVDDTQTQYRNNKSGATITLRTTATFRQRFADVPRAQLASAGREVATLPDAAIFEVVPDPADHAPSAPPHGAP